MTATTLKLGPFDMDKVARTVERINERLRRGAAALDAAGVPYAVIGGNAVINWVSRVDESMVRFTKDVDFLLRRADLEAATAALTPVGFVFRKSGAMTMFLDGPDAKARDAIHVLFAAERVRETDLVPAPDVDECEATGEYRVLRLEALVRMKLNANRDHDRTHVRDLIKVGLVDASWVGRFTGELAVRLQYCLDTVEDD